MHAPIELSMLSDENNLHLETKMTNVIEFLSLRRSVTAKTMAVGNVDPSHLDQILAVGIRVPDHGALKPWRLVVISGAARARLDSEIIHAEFKASNPDAKPEVEEIEKSSDGLSEARGLSALFCLLTSMPRLGQGFSEKRSQ